MCRGCTFRRLMDDELREAVAAVLGGEDYEPRFVKDKLESGEVRDNMLTWRFAFPLYRANGEKL